MPLACRDLTDWMAFPLLPQGTFTASFAQGCMWIINKIPGLCDIEADSNAIKDRFVIFGESAVIGLILGIILGVVSRFNFTQTAQLSIELAAVLPGANFIPVASLAVLPYWIGGMVPYTKGNVIHTVIIATIWIIPATLIVSQLAPICTTLCANTGLFTSQIYTNWEEGGNLLLWVLVQIGHLFGH